MEATPELDRPQALQMQLYATVQPQESALADFNTALWLKHPAELGRPPDPVRARGARGSVRDAEIRTEAAVHWTETEGKAGHGPHCAWLRKKRR